MVSGLAKQGLLPRTVLDVGANTGQFAVASAKLFPNVRVRSFEPVPECFEELRENVRGLGNVVAYPLALGESEGEVSFHVNAYSHSSSALPLTQAHREAFPDARETRTTTVKVSTLDRVFAGTELPRPVLLKLDVQGYEARVLRGGAETLKHVDYVVLEASFKPLYEGEMLFMDVVRLMEGHGFRFERPVGWLAAPRSREILQMDALFVRDG
jgi:FkbM family methyltransferase